MLSIERLVDGRLVGNGRPTGGRLANKRPVGWQQAGGGGQADMRLRCVELRSELGS